MGGWFTVPNKSEHDENIDLALNHLALYLVDNQVFRLDMLDKVIQNLELNQLNNLSLHEVTASEEKEIRKSEIDSIKRYLGKNVSDWLIAVCITGNLNLLKFLIKKGADINFIDKNGHTVLSRAILHNEKAIIKYLIDQGVDVNFVSETYPFGIFPILTKNRLNDKSIYIWTNRYLLYGGAFKPDQQGDAIFHDKLRCFKVLENVAAAQHKASLVSQYNETACIRSLFNLYKLIMLGLTMKINHPLYIFFRVGVYDPRILGHIAAFLIIEDSN